MLRVCRPQDTQRFFETRQLRPSISIGVGQGRSQVSKGAAQIASTAVKFEDIPDPRRTAACHGDPSQDVTFVPVKGSDRTGFRYIDHRVLYSSLGTQVTLELLSTPASPDHSDCSIYLEIGSSRALAMISSSHSQSANDLNLVANYPKCPLTDTSQAPVGIGMHNRRTNEYHVSSLGHFHSADARGSSGDAAMLATMTRGSFQDQDYPYNRSERERTGQYSSHFDYPPSTIPYNTSHSAPTGSMDSDQGQSRHFSDPSTFSRADGTIQSPRYPNFPPEISEDPPSDNESNEGHRAPTLIRTSTLPQFQGPPQTSTTQPVPDFNPFNLYPNQKAVLEIDHARLDRMNQGWDSAEYENQRRLIHFTRSQEGGKIIAHFEPISADQWDASKTCVSCIWWRQKDKYYITSVDTILLLEALVGARFTVEEKNRIRRNLEGFKPETISKLKGESEDFFKLIMGFPSPRPRNIEKDVKVFEWELLSKSLTKIIGKYSASYASHSGTMNAPTPLSDLSIDSVVVSRPASGMDLRSISPANHSYQLGPPQSSTYPLQPLPSTLTSPSGAYGQQQHPHAHGYYTYQMPPGSYPGSMQGPGMQYMGGPVPMQPRYPAGQVPGAYPVYQQGQPQAPHPGPGMYDGSTGYQRQR